MQAERETGAKLEDHHAHDDPEHAAIEHDENAISEFEVLEEALRELCIEKGLFTAADVQGEVQTLESRTPKLSAQLVARSWLDAGFRTALLANAFDAAAKAGIDMTGSPPVQAVENTPVLHHVVACTLCSCYPRALLGRPPAWYKSRAYRARIVIDPRGVLREFGTELPDATQIKVVDSTADLRYLVVPMRPPDTEGWAIDKLAELVPRDSMIGVAPAQTPTNS
jgi:nitrile hydratase